MITVYGDLACPFASLALHGLRGARARAGRADIALDIRPFPLELINERPHSRERLEAEKAELTAVEPALGWRRWPEGADSAWPVSTLLPLAAVVAANRPSVGGLVAGDALDAALRRAFYVEHRCITLLPVVLDTARGCPEVNADALAEELRGGVGIAEVVDGAGKDRVARGSPHVFAGGRDWLNPGVELDDQHRVTRYDPAVYDEILATAA